MIIPDHEIRKLLENGRVRIEPLDEGQIQAACVDLRLGGEFRVFKHTHEALIDSRNPKEYTECIAVGGRPFIIHPGEFVLGITKERVALPADISAYVDGKSSLGRLGVTAHITSSLVEPGWDGRLVLEIANLGKMPVSLYPDMKICKLVLMRMSSASEKPYGARNETKYKGQDGVTESRISRDGLC
jgi:dCTP deaminase